MEVILYSKECNCLLIKGFCYRECPLRETILYYNKGNFKIWRKGRKKHIHTHTRQPIKATKIRETESEWFYYLLNPVQTQ